MRFLLFVPIAAALIASSAQAASVQSRNFGIRSFEKIRVEGPYRVTLKTGTAPFARAKGPPGALDRIDLEMRGDVLIVRAALAAKSASNAALAPVDIELGTHDLESATLTGSGSLSVDKVKALKFDIVALGASSVDIAKVDVDQLSLTLGGNAASRLSGKSKQMKAVLRGLSTLDASGLAVSDAEFGADGPTTIRANIDKAVEIEARGTASIVLAGQPSCTLKLQGSVSVSGCK